MSAIVTSTAPSSTRRFWISSYDGDWSTARGFLAPAPAVALARRLRAARLWHPDAGSGGGTCARTGHDRRRHGLHRHRPRLSGRRQDGADPHRREARPAQGAACGASTRHPPDRRLRRLGRGQTAPRSDARDRARDRARGRPCIPPRRRRLGPAARGGQASDRGGTRAPDGHHAAADRRGRGRGLPHRGAARTRGVPARAGAGRGRRRARARLRYRHLREHPGHARAFPPASRMHMAKIIECASLCCVPGGRDTILGVLDDHGFELESMAPNRAATPSSVAAHRSTSRPIRTRSASRADGPICATSDTGRWTNGARASRAQASSRRRGRR